MARAGHSARFRPFHPRRPRRYPHHASAANSRSSHPVHGLPPPRRKPRAAAMPTESFPRWPPRGARVCIPLRLARQFFERFLFSPPFRRIPLVRRCAFRAVATASAKWLRDSVLRARIFGGGYLWITLSARRGERTLLKLDFALPTCYAAPVSYASSPGVERGEYISVDVRRVSPDPERRSEGATWRGALGNTRRGIWVFHSRFWGFFFLLFGCGMGFCGICVDGDLFFEVGDLWQFLEFWFFHAKDGFSELFIIYFCLSKECCFYSNRNFVHWEKKCWKRKFTAFTVTRNSISPRKFYKRLILWWKMINFRLIK